MTARDAYSANETIQQKFPDHQIINLNTCAELETLVGINTPFSVATDELKRYPDLAHR